MQMSPHLRRQMMFNTAMISTSPPSRHHTRRANFGLSFGGLILGFACQA